MLSRVKKNDTVVVLGGKDKGKKGLVLAVYPKKDLALVKDIGIVVRHVKASGNVKKGGIIREERPVFLDKVMPICSACKKPCRVRAKVLDSGVKVRVCVRCKEAF